jgi:hypothetical protein
MKNTVGKFNLIGLILLVGILLSACGGTGSGHLEDIPNGFDGPELLIVGSDSATIRFDTGVPTVCNAPFGETEDYGEVATIPMLSGATLDHVLTFNGLEADTEYHYKIIATDNAGNVYQSGDFTFRTAAVDESLGSNWLSLEAGAQVVDVSSNFGGAANDETWGANGAIDGNRGSEWSSAGDGDAAFIDIELAETVRIDQLVVHSRSMSNDTAQIFAFQVRTDADEIYGPFQLPNADEGHVFEVDITASSLRFEALETSGGNTGFVEIEAYGELAGG